MNHIRLKNIVGILCLALILACFPLQSPAQSAGAQFVEKHKKTALVLMRRSGIPASIILGISMVESAMGRSKNCRLLNNYFGVKGKNNLHKGKSGHRSAYKQYPDAAASFKDFVRIVQRKQYYPALKGNMHYKKWLVKMNQHGYAEAKGKWIKDVEQMIRNYDLEEVDKEGVLVEDDNSVIWGTDSTLIELQE